MVQDWLLVETLGDEPAVVAQGRQMKNFVPISVFLRRNPNLAAIQTAIAETVAAGTGLASITPKTNRMIRTEPVRMTDGRIHGVHVWVGAVGSDPPERPTPGPFKADQITGIMTGSAEALSNGGIDVDVEQSYAGAIGDYMPERELNRDESEVLALPIDPIPSRTVSTTWDYTDKLGRPRRLGFVLRAARETVEDGSEHIIVRGMNLLGDLGDVSLRPSEGLSQRILDGLSEPGVHRALFDMDSRIILKWLDEPCPFFDWRGALRFHPDDIGLFDSLVAESDQRTTCGTIRLPGNGVEWVPVHVSVTRVEVGSGRYAGLIKFGPQPPTELSDAGLAAAAERRPG